MPDEQHEATDNNATDKKEDLKTSLICYCEIVVSKPKLTFGKICGTKGQLFLFKICYKATTQEFNHQ